MLTSIFTILDADGTTRHHKFFIYDIAMITLKYAQSLLSFWSIDHVVAGRIKPICLPYWLAPYDIKDSTSLSMLGFGKVNGSHWATMAHATFGSKLGIAHSS